MQIKKELPEIFGEFGEMRQKSFLAAYEMKQKNIPFVGTFCTYFPQEIDVYKRQLPFCTWRESQVTEVTCCAGRRLFGKTSAKSVCSCICSPSSLS